MASADANSRPLLHQLIRGGSPDGDDDGIGSACLSGPVAGSERAVRLSFEVIGAGVAAVPMARIAVVERFDVRELIGAGFFAHAATHRGHALVREPAAEALERRQRSRRRPRPAAPVRRRRAMSLSRYRMKRST